MITAVLWKARVILSKVNFLLDHGNDSKCLQRWPVTKSVIMFIKYIADVGGQPLGELKM